jgi:hypothetical protein
LINQQGNIGQYRTDLERLFQPRRLSSSNPAMMSVAGDHAKERRIVPREREMLCGGALLELARDLNGTKEGIANKGNRALALYLEKKPNIKRKDIEKHSREIGAHLNIVKPQLFKELVV